MKLLPLLLLSALACASFAPAAATSGSAARSAPAAVMQRARGGTSFDYYLLNLSWAPEFCHSKPDNPECSGHFGFIVHGLWPQYRNGGYPESCGQAPGLSNPTQMLDLMPDPHLIQHEWSVHGTCSGLTADDYFALIRKAFAAVKIPSAFVNAPRQFNIGSADLKSKFEQSNPGLTDAGLAISCGSGSYLVAVEICLTKDGKPTPCGAGIRDCHAPAIRVPKIQR